MDENYQYKCIDIDECSTIPGICESDTRPGYCFTSVTNGRCINQLPQLLPKPQCCCDTGRCWSSGAGGAPEICPFRGTDEYRKLCTMSWVRPGVPEPGPVIPVGPGYPPPIGPEVRPPVYPPIFPQPPVPGYIRPTPAAPVTSLNFTQDYCLLYRNLCIHGRCIPTPGSYRCECNTGFHLDGRGECIEP
ncbi:unnamed protein product [Ranitomeya imitator]|uniref:TB domain-containing protein n=1 Tax=Ranitomeya imitator TaxID=111125 RepID=A0ABN9MJV8_9NEOB|nr:unnamed protein product [Ranitomeya imitator]